MEGVKEKIKQLIGEADSRSNSLPKRSAYKSTERSIINQRKKKKATNYFLRKLGAKDIVSTLNILDTYQPNQKEVLWNQFDVNYKQAEIDYDNWYLRAFEVVKSTGLKSCMKKLKNSKQKAKLETRWRHGKIALDNALAFLKENKENKIESEKIDTLTGLSDRDVLDKLELDKFEKVSIAFLDIDNFKGINDKYGHDKGDIAIKYVASVLKELEKENCQVLRNHGRRGDEFTVVFFNLDKGKSFELMEEFRKKIENNMIENLFKVTMSIGIASYPDDGTIKEDIIKKADKAMYFSKENGKNRTTLYSSDMKKETDSIQFRFDGIANIRKGSKILVKRWQCNNPPNIHDLEAIEMVDTDEDILYTSSNKGLLMTLKTIEIPIEGIVSKIERPPHSTLFKLEVNKKQLESIPSERKDFVHSLVS